MGEQGGLVVAPGQQPAAMQRHGDKQICRLQQDRTGPRHVPGEGGCYVHTVRMLQRQDDPPGLIVIPQGGAAAVPRRWMQCALAALVQQATLPSVAERRAAPVAARLGDEVRGAEAMGAKPPLRLDRRVAGQAARWQHQVQPCHRKPGEDAAADRDGLGERDHPITVGRRRNLRPLGITPGRAHIGPMNEIFDRRAVRLHRDRAADRVARVSPVLADVAERLLDRLDDISRPFTRALDLGGRGHIAPRLRARGIDTVSCELSPAMARLDGAVVGDAEWLPFGPASFDLVVANLSLHWINDLPGALIQIRAALRPDGLLLASMPALGTLAELRSALAEAEADMSGGASPRVSPFAGLADCAALLQRAGFALPVADGDSITLAYADPFDLLRDLQAAGEANAVALRDRRVPPRDLFAAALARLPVQDGRAAVTLRLAMMTGWAPSASQPKPAARGSGQTSLSDALR